MNPQRYYANNGQVLNFNINTEKYENYNQINIMPYTTPFYNYTNVIQPSHTSIISHIPSVESKNTGQRSKETNTQTNRKRKRKYCYKTQDEPWCCKCCDKEADNIKNKCKICQSPRTHSESNPDQNKNIITHGYCLRVKLNVPAMIIDLIGEHVTFQKAQFHITCTKNEINEIIKAHIRSDINAKYVRNPKKVKLLQLNTYKFKFVDDNDLLCMLRKKFKEYWYREKKIDMHKDSTNTDENIETIDSNRSVAQRLHIKALNLTKENDKLKQELLQLKSTIRTNEENVYLLKQSHVKLTDIPINEEVQNGNILLTKSC
eukprot:60358_1